MSEGRKAFLLRISAGLWRELERWAQEEFRSVNGQIEFLLREAVRRRRGDLSAGEEKSHPGVRGSSVRPEAAAPASSTPPTSPPDSELEMGRHD